MAFAKLKAHSRTIAAGTIGDLWRAIGQITGDEARVTRRGRVLVGTAASGAKRPFAKWAFMEWPLVADCVEKLLFADD